MATANASGPTAGTGSDLANAQDPITMFKRDAFQGNGCTQLNLYGKAQEDAYATRGFTSGTCNGAGYTRFAGCSGSCSQGGLYLK